MEFRTVGRSGLQVSVVGLGCNMFGERRVAGRGLDYAGAKAVIDRCIEEGITFFDTADFYGEGKSEEFLGQALKTLRHDVVVATKVGAAMGAGPYNQGSSRRYLLNAVDNSLKRLGTDYIDLLQMHYPDPLTPIEETLRVLDDIVHAGKVRHIGSCNFYGRQIVEADWVAKAGRLNRFVSAQNEYNLLQRIVDVEIGPACQEQSIGFLPYHPLASGFLTGKYRPGEAAPDDARLKSGPHAAAMLTEGNYDQLIKLETFAKDRGHTILELAMSWLAGRPFVASVIAGATKPEHVVANARAAQWKLTGEDYAAIDEIMNYIPPDPRRGGTPQRRRAH